GRTFPGRTSGRRSRPPGPTTVTPWRWRPHPGGTRSACTRSTPARAPAASSAAVLSVFPERACRTEVVQQTISSMAGAWDRQDRQELVLTAASAPGAATRHDTCPGRSEHDGDCLD